MGEVSGTFPPLLLGRYRTESVIGEGAFGHVERAFDTRLKRPVAIKTLKRSLAQDDLYHFRQVEDRFVREAEAGARVGSHANLVTVYDLLEDHDGSLHLVLQFVPGGTIADRLASHGPFSIADGLRLTADIARGLQAAHDAGIVHRDIKPANIFLAADGRAQVGDFGIAQLDHLSARTSMSVGHPGTPLYMSPEQAGTTGYVRPTSDQYSVGLTLFELLHGQPYKRLRGGEIADFLATLQSPVAALIERMVAVAPDDRFREMADIALAIRRIEQSLGLDTISPNMPSRPAPSPAAPVMEAPAEPSAAASIPARPVSVPSLATPDVPVKAASTEAGRPVMLPTAKLLPAREGIATQPVHDTTPTHTEPTTGTPRGDKGWEPRVATADATPDRSPPIAHAGGEERARQGTPGTARKVRGVVAAIVGAMVLVLIAGGLVAASRLNDGGRSVTASSPATGGPSPSEPAPFAIPVRPTATAIAPLPVTSAPTATSIAPTATVAAARQETVILPPTVTPTATPTAIPPTATSVPSLGVFGAGTTDRGDLETLSPADAVDAFTAGQEVFVFLNYDGARAGVERFDIAVVADGRAQQTQSVTVQKSGGFVTVSLGKPAAGNYRIEVRHNDALLPNQPTFQVKAPEVTPVPAAPRTAPVGGGQQPAVQQPAAQPKAPTCAPGTC